MVDFSCFEVYGCYKDMRKGIFLMSTFVTQMKLERKRLAWQISNAEKKLDIAPQGSLTIRKRKRGVSYYRNTTTRKNAELIRKQTNITGNTGLIRQLVEKVIQKKILSRACRNLIHLDRLIEEYQSTEMNQVKSELGDTYRDALELLKKEYLMRYRTTDYPKAPFDPRYHVHETDCGELVRSKSEQIILNALTPHSEFITHYEEELLYEIGIEGVGRVYPDFTIILPNGKRILWEHWGRLDDPEYCKRNALKLCLYQRNGYVLGDNLIITMDDRNGNISSVLVAQAIQQILAKL